MKNNRSIRRAVTGVLVAAMLAGTAAAASAATIKTIEAHYMGIQLVVNGVQVTPKDANGNTVEPFISEGTTYLPVRAIANALGEDVQWDGETKTVYIGEIPGQEENWMKKLPPYQVGPGNSGAIYDGSDPKKYFTVAGNDHTSGVWLRDGSGNADPYALWNTNAQYGSMTFTIGHVDNSNEHDVTLEVYLDGELAESYDVAWDGPPQTITVPLNYAASVKLSVHDADPGLIVIADMSAYGIYDISFAP